jgi:hypothetical protein
MANMGDETELPLHGLQHYVKLDKSGKSRKLNEPPDAPEFNQILVVELFIFHF